MNKEKTAGMGIEPVPANFLPSKRVACQAKRDHCCYIENQVCPALRDDGPNADRRWVCTFREKLGSWDAVHADPEYLETVGNKMKSLIGVYCGDWPKPNEQCNECGAING